MEPNFNPSPHPPSDPYAFLNESKRTSPLTVLTNLSGRGKIFFGLGLVIFLIIVLALAKSLFGGNSGINVTSLTIALSEQQELINLATTGTQQSQVMSQSYLNFSYTTIASVTTDAMQLNKLLTYNGIKINPNIYTQQPSVNTELKQVEQTSNFDSTYSTVMKQQLDFYKKDLSQAYNLNKSAVVRSYLTKDYKNTMALIKMLGSSYG